MRNDNAKADVDISVADELDAADAAVVSDGLRTHYVSQAGYYDFRPLAVFVRDPQTGKVIGGLHGRSEFGLVYVAWFFLPEDRRALGSAAGCWRWRKKRGQTTRLHSNRVDDAQHRGARLLPETGLRCRGDNRLRAARPHALLPGEKALTNGQRLARYVGVREALRERHSCGATPVEQ